MIAPHWWDSAAYPDLQFRGLRQCGSVCAASAARSPAPAALERWRLHAAIPCTVWIGGSVIAWCMETHAHVACAPTIPILHCPALPTFKPATGPLEQTGHGEGPVGAELHCDLGGGELEDPSTHIPSYADMLLSGNATRTQPGICVWATQQLVLLLFVVCSSSSPPPSRTCCLRSCLWAAPPVS